MTTLPRSRRKATKRAWALIPERSCSIHARRNRPVGASGRLPSSEKFPATSMLVTATSSMPARSRRRSIHAGPLTLSIRPLVESNRITPLARAPSFASPKRSYRAWTREYSSKGRRVGARYIVPLRDSWGRRFPSFSRKRESIFLRRQDCAHSRLTTESTHRLKSFAPIESPPYHYA